MNKKISTRPYLNLINALYLAFFVTVVAGCGPSASDREKVRTEKFEEVKQQRLQKTLEITDGLKEKYQAVDFPWGSSVSSEEVVFFSALAQRFIAENKQKPILLMMNLEDIEQSKNGLVAKFSMRFVRSFVATPKELKLSLIISEDQFSELKKMPTKTSVSRQLANYPTIFVVAKINEISSMKEAIYDDDGKYSIKSELHGTGVLLDAKLRTEK
jgi:hypothetical protein